MLTPYRLSCAHPLPILVTTGLGRIDLASASGLQLVDHLGAPLSAQVLCRMRQEVMRPAAPRASTLHGVATRLPTPPSQK